MLTAIDEQSSDIAMGVNAALEKKSGSRDAFAEIGAGDQGMMFGFACDETEELMPLPISLAHCLTRKLAQVRKCNHHSPLLPDGKSQVTVEYGDDGRPLRVDTVVISSQHRADIELAELRPYIVENVIKATLPEGLMDHNTRILINPTGRFVIGGPQGDTGLTGRKIIVDTYGGMARHGGGAFSGKDPHQGGPFRFLYGPLHRQEYRSRRFGQALRDPAGLRHRRVGAGLSVGGYLRHRQGRGLPIGGRR